MANIFESIGKGVGNVVGGIGKGAADIFGGLAQGVSDVAGFVPAIAAQRSRSADIESRIEQRKLQMMNTAAGMLFNTPPEQQGAIITQLTNIGFDEDDIKSAQQIAASGQPLSFEEFSKIGKDSGLARTIDVGPQGKVTGGRFSTPTGKQTATRTAKEIIENDPTIRGFQIEIDKIETDMIREEKTVTAKNLEEKKKEIAKLGKRKDEIVRKREKRVAELRRFEVETVTDTTPAITRPSTGFEDFFPGGVKKGSTVTLTPAKTTTRLKFTPVATPQTAPSILAPEPPQLATKKKSTKLDKTAKSKGAGMQALRKALSDKIINATEFKHIQNSIKNKTMTVEQAVARLEEIRKAK